MYITKTPLSGYPAPEDIGCITINKVNERNYTVKILAIVTEIKEIVTKKGEKMAFLTCEDNTGTLSAVMFPKTWNKFMATIFTGSVFILVGRSDEKDNKKSFIINDINEPMTDEDNILIHVNSWDEWNAIYYPEAVKCASASGKVLYIHNRKSGQIIRFSKKMKNFKIF